MKYNPKIHKRRSIRLKWYDYSQEGLYFVTICCQDRAYLFGDVINGEMKLNDAGAMISKWYYKLEEKYPDIKCQEMIIMPNHFHCIIENVGLVVGADPSVCPESGKQPDALSHEHIDSSLGEHIDSSLGEHKGSSLGEHIDSSLGEHKGSSLGEHKGSSLGEHMGTPLQRVVQWFKTMTTNEYIHGVKNLGWQRFNGKLWQRNYYEHIVRNERSYQHISDYTIDNPLNWGEDKFWKS